jgi:hypothetical protein
MSNLLFTGQVAIPDIKGSVRDLSTILQNNTILQQKQLEAQAKQTAATQKLRSETMKSLYGEGLSGVHEAALPFVRQALDEVALQIDPLLDQDGGDLLAQRMIRNAIDSVARYKDDDAWHDAEQRYIALGDTTTAEYAKVKGELGPGMRPVTTTDATMLGDIARGRGVRGMRSVVNPDGTFSIRGFDSDALEETDISQMTWWNSENLFNNSVQYAGVEVASLQEQGERWKVQAEKDGPYDAASARSHFENYVRRDGEFFFQDFLGATPDSEIFQLRLSAYARDREKLLGQFTELDDRSLLDLYQLRESDFQGRDTLRKAITKSLDDAIDEAVRYTPYTTDDDEDGDGENASRVYNNAQQGKTEDIDVLRLVTPLSAGGYMTPPTFAPDAKTARFNLRALDPNVLNPLTISRPNPEYLQLVEALTREGKNPEQIQAEIQAMLIDGENVPDSTKTFKIDDIQLIEGADGLAFLNLFDSEDVVMINFNSVRPEDEAIIGYLKQAFAESGLTFEGFQDAANQLWGATSAPVTTGRVEAPSPSGNNNRIDYSQK